MPCILSLFFRLQLVCVHVLSLSLKFNLLLCSFFLSSLSSVPLSDLSFMCLAICFDICARFFPLSCWSVWYFHDLCSVRARVCVSCCFWFYFFWCHLCLVNIVWLQYSHRELDENSISPLTIIRNFCVRLPISCSVLHCNRSVDFGSVFLVH